ncbi:MAG: transposase domain-containing protein [Firmicutes bacterium]|nr:transposase domain-containing protein [Bacillota bacterium]
MSTISAILYSLIESAKENSVIPFDYLTRVFREAPNLPDGGSIDGLLPGGVVLHI